MNKDSESAWVRKFCDLVCPGGEVLDLACGGGRHGRFFLSRGHPVVMLDRDVSRVVDMQSLQGVELVQADLENGSPWPLPGRQFAAVVVTNYLHRPLFPSILAALAPGGLLIYETFAVGNEKFGRPSNPEYLLRPAELLAVTESHLQVVAYEELETEAPKPAKVQRIVARALAQGVAIDAATNSEIH